MIFFFNLLNEKNFFQIGIVTETVTLPKQQ